VNLTFFDTETTGLWDKTLPCGHEGQPRIAQVAAMMVDATTREEIQRIDLIVYRDQPIPVESSNIHGTTTERSQALGVNENAALDILCDMIACSDLMIAHNIEFDVNIVNNAARLMSGNPKMDVFAGKKQFCTMLAAVPICKFPSRFGHKGYAWPKLEKAVPLLLGREPTAAHRAIGDVIDCRDLFWFLQDHAAAAIASQSAA
jgi:DNA polymerase III epsilon subunit-like protein